MQAGCGCGPRVRERGYRLVFLDRLLVTLVALRHGVTHDVLAAWFGVDRSTVTRAIGEIRPILRAQPAAGHSSQQSCTRSLGTPIRGWTHAGRGAGLSARGSYRGLPSWPAAAIAAAPMSRPSSV